MSKKKDATEQGVSEEVPEVEQPEEQVEEPEGGKALEPEEWVDPRHVAMEAIAAKYEQELADEEGYPVEGGEGPEEVQADSDEVTEEAKEPEPEDGTEEEAPQAVSEDPEETIVVDGEERKVPLSKILDAGRRTLQKKEAADKKLEEATRLHKEAMDMLRQAEERAKAVDDKPVKKEEDPQEEDVSDEQYIAAIEAIQMGDTEEGTKALKQLLKGRRSAPTTPIDKVALEVVRKELYNREMQSVRERFYSVPDEGGFSDLVPEDEGGTGDHITLAAVNAEVARLIRDEKKPDAWATYKQAGLNIRARFNPQAPTREQGDPTKDKEEAKEKKTERKRKLVSVKSAAGAPIIPEAEKEETAADIIRKMRLDRGQDIAV